VRDQTLKTHLESCIAVIVFVKVEEGGGGIRSWVDVWDRIPIERSINIPMRTQAEYMKKNANGEGSLGQLNAFHRRRG